MELFFRACVVLFVASLLAGPAEAQRIGLLVEPSEEAIEEGDAWHRTIEFAAAVADGLGLDLRVLYANGTPAGALRALHQATAGDKPVQAMLLWDFQEMALPMVKVCERAIIPYLFYGDPPIEEVFRAASPTPARRVGSIQPDWEQATPHAFELLLAEAATRLAGSAPYHAAGIGARRAGSVFAAQKRAAERVQGREMRLHQILYGNGDKAAAQRKVAGLLFRYPNLQLLFAGQQTTTEGALAELEARGLRPGADLILNGVGATQKQIGALQEGHIAAILAGDELSAGWGLIILQSVLHHPPETILPTRHLHPLYLLTESNLRDHAWLLEEPRWSRFDFPSFARNRGEGQDAFDLRRVPRRTP